MVEEKYNPADIYFLEEYAKSTEFLNRGLEKSFFYEDDNGSVLNRFLIRDIDLDGVSLDEKYYDIQTPYGYGGPIITSLTGDKGQLVENYYRSFKKYCNDNNIVSEFVRFHPIEKNYEDFSNVMDVKFIRKTVATVLKDKKDPFTEEFGKNSRKLIRKILKEDISYEIIEKPQNLDKFIKIYYDTMDRNDALDFYYFERDYFDYLLNNLRDYILNINVYYDNKTIASGLYFYYDKYLHAHLSGTDHNYLFLSPAYLLKYLTLEWGKEHGVEYIHYGGGTTNDPEDSLLKFKSKFTKEGFFDYYVGQNIYNQEVYDYLVEISGKKDSEYFPKYRA